MGSGKILQTGFVNSAAEVLKQKCDDMSERSKEAVLVLDEMSIRRDLSYNSNSDIIDGLEDLGFQRTSAIGGEICVFMLRGLFDSWKCVLNYFVSESAIKGHSLKEIVQKNLEHAMNLGFKVRAVVCDQGSNNRKCFSEFGVTKEKPYIIRNNKKIFFLYDFPHLVKSLRNQLLKSDLVTSDGEVSFKVIRELYELERNKVTKMCPKLTEKHINPNNFEKMRVSLATQVFSRSVAAGIRTTVVLKKFINVSEQISENTAKFVERVDNIFDCMNSGSSFDKNIAKSGIKKDNEVYKSIKQFITYIQNVRLPEGQKKTVYCLSGIEHTLRATLLLWEDISEFNEGIDFLLTKRLNQDVVENLFSLLRAKGGNNKNPSVFEINMLLAKILSINLLQYSPSGNCMNDDENMIHINFNSIDGQNEQTDLASNGNNDMISNDTSNIENTDISQIYEHLIIEDEFQEGEIELNAMRYFCGYVAYKILHKIDCISCDDNVRKRSEILSRPSEHLIFAKNYSKKSDFGNLFAPTDHFFNICNIHFEIFKEIFDGKKEITNIKKFIIEKCIEATKMSARYEDWFNEENPCFQHRKDFLDFSILVLLRKHCKWATYKRVLSKNNRLQILSSN